MGANFMIDISRESLDETPAEVCFMAMDKMVSAMNEYLQQLAQAKPKIWLMNEEFKGRTIPCEYIPE